MSYSSYSQYHYLGSPGTPTWTASNQLFEIVASKSQHSPVFLSRGRCSPISAPALKSRLHVEHFHIAKSSSKGHRPMPGAFTRLAGHPDPDARHVNLPGSLIRTPWCASSVSLPGYGYTCIHYRCRVFDKYQTRKHRPHIYHYSTFEPAQVPSSPT